LEICVSHGSVATQLKCVGIFNSHLIANCPQYVSVKEFWKSVNIWRRYGKWQRETFFWGHSVLGLKERWLSANNHLSK